MSAFKLITFLFPFIKEMVLGEKTIREALRTNKMRVFLIGLILLSFFLNIVLVPKLVRISADYVILDRKYKELEEKYTAFQKSSHPVSAPAHEPEKPPPKKEEKEQPAPDPTPVAPPVVPVPQVPQDTPTPAVDVPPEPARRPARHSRRDQHSSAPPTAEETNRRYSEWKRTFDSIRQDQARERDDH